jgi:hypothetical protein
MTDEPNQIKQSLGMPMFQIWSSEIRRARNIVNTLKGVKRASIYGDSLHVTIEQREIFDQLVTALRSKDIKIQGQREIVPSLEDIFISMVQK